MASSLYGDVHLGFWIDQLRGSVHGATLTLDHKSGNLLISFLALFIALAGSGLWKIIRLIIHFMLSRESSSDGIYHQRQVILRNSTAQDTVIALVEACHAWRKRGSTLLRMLPVALIAALLAAAVTITGGLSSRFILSSDGSEVLLAGDPGYCGPNNLITNVLSNSNDPLQTRYITTEYLNYVLNCYNSPGGNGCADFVKPWLTFRNETNATCPFTGDVCRSPTGNFIAETNFLDSATDVGVNIGPRVLFQHKMHCAPLSTTGYTDVSFDNDTRSNFLSYKYGSRPSKFPYFNPVQVNVTAPLNDEGDYHVTSIAASNADNGSITLIPQLNLSDARTIILWMDSSSIYNQFKIEDPWFAATTPRDLPDLSYETPSKDIWYTADEPRGVMGCATYFTFCNPNFLDETGCVNPHAAGSDEEMKRIWTDKDDLAFLRSLAIVLNPVQAGTIDNFYKIPSVPYLERRDTIQGNRQVATDFHPRTWQFELEYVFQGMLAAVQRNAIEFASGAYFPDGVACSKNDPCLRPCRFQKVRSSLHYSFSVLALCLVFILGGIILIISYGLNHIVDAAFKIHAFRHNPKLRFAYAEWQTGTTLQLLRLAHEGIGVGDWSGATESIPVTEPGDVLGVLDVSDMHHPRLVAPSARVEDVVVVQAKDKES